MKKYLITGCAGFIGSNFVYYMLKKYEDILLVNLDKLTYAGNLENLNDIPGELPACRTKPWGTGQAVLAAKNMIDTPFIVINADDYYGKEASRPFMSIW